MTPVHNSIQYSFSLRPTKIAELMQQIDTSRFDRLSDPLCNWDEPSLLAELGAGVLRQMRRECRILRLIVREIRMTASKFPSGVVGLRIRVAYLRMVIPFALVENRVLRFLPSLPGILTRLCSWLWCDIMTTLEVELELSDPTVTVIPK